MNLRSSACLACSRTISSIRLPIPWAAQPKWVSKIWPTFIREGTPSGFNTMSTGRPSAINGISSAGAILETTPLLPWRPAILSPGCKRRLTAKYTLTIFVTPGCKSSPWVSLVRFSSKASSNCLRFASMEDLMASTWVATSSSAGRISNQWYLSRSSR